MKSRLYGLGVAALVLLSQPAFATTVPGSGADELVMLGIAILCVGGFAGVVSGSMGMAKGRPLTAFLLPILLLPAAANVIGGSPGLDGYFELMAFSAFPYVPAFFVGCWMGRAKAPARKAALPKGVAEMIEEQEPGQTFSHLSQTTHTACGQSFTVHVCRVAATGQYRSYVYCNEALVAWAFERGRDCEADPDSPAARALVEKLVADTVNEVIANNLDLYSRASPNF